MAPYSLILSFTFLFIHICISSNNHNEHTSKTTDFPCTDKCTPYTIDKDKQCDYVRECCSNSMEDVLFDYVQIQYCTFSSMQYIGIIILCILLIYSFWILESIADGYFAPIMEQISKALKISDELAGVTIMAFGNGAPEISASASAIIAGGNTANLGLGTLLGTSILIPIMSAGIIAVMVRNAAVSSTPFLRDCFFLFLATGCILAITFAQRMTMIQAIGLMAIYIFYVLSVLSGEVYKKWRAKLEQRELERRNRKTSAINYDSEVSRTFTDRIMPVIGVYAFERNPLASTSKDYVIKRKKKTPQPKPKTTREKILLQKDKKFPRKNSINTETYKQPLIRQYEREESMTVSKLKKKLDREEEYRNKNEIDIRKKCCKDILKIPIYILGLAWKITIPLTDEENWNDWIAMASCIIAPVWIQFAFLPDTMSEWIFNDTVPLVAFVGVIGFEMALFTFWRVRRKYKIGKIHDTQRNDEDLTVQLSHLSKNGFAVNENSHIEVEYDENEEVNERMSKRNEQLKRQCVMKHFFILIGFLSAIGWLRKTADELVNLMSTLGVVSTVDTTLLGLTVLSWGMSMHDLMAIVSVSKRGYAKMGISASIGGPTFNLLVGVGIGGLVATIKSPNRVMTMPFTLHIFASCICCMLGIFIFAIWTAINKWQLKKSFGFFCICYYITYLTVIGVIYRFM